MVLKDDAAPQQPRSIPVLVTSVSHNEIRATADGVEYTRTTDEALETVRRFRKALATDAQMAVAGLLDLDDPDVTERMATTALLRYRDVPQLIELALDTLLIHKTLEEVVGLIDATLGIRGVALDVEG